MKLMTNPAITETKRTVPWQGDVTRRMFVKTKAYIGIAEGTGKSGIETTVNLAKETALFGTCGN